MSLSDENNIEQIKIILIGRSGVGKTNLINTSIGLNFNSNEATTVSGSYVAKNYKINNQDFVAHLWDTAGQEAYKGITQLFFRDSKIIILVYDICSSASLKDLEEWYELCEETINNDHIYGIAGNKKDLYLEEEVSEEEGRKFAESINAKFRLVSAKEDPKSFIDFIKELIIDLKKITIRTRSPSIKINKNTHDNEKKKESCCK